MRRTLKVDCARSDHVPGTPNVDVVPLVITMSIIRSPASTPPGKFTTSAGLLLVVSTVVPLAMYASVPVPAAAGDASESTSTGAVHATAPTAAARLISVRRPMPSASAPVPGASMPVPMSTSSVSTDFRRVPTRA